MLHTFLFEVSMGNKVSARGDEGDMHKILVVGDAGVGKTACVSQFCDKAFDRGYVSTVGIDFKVKKIYVEGKQAKVKIWDTAGQERYRPITHAYFSRAKGFLLMFDVTNNESFLSVKTW